MSEAVANFWSKELADYGERLHFGYIEFHDDGRWFAFDGMMMRRIPREDIPQDMKPIYNPGKVSPNVVP